MTKTKNEECFFMLIHKKAQNPLLGNDQVRGGYSGYERCGSTTW